MAEPTLPLIRTNAARQRWNFRPRCVENRRANRGVQALVDLYQVLCAGLNSPGRPVGTSSLLGPTGSGKTRIVEAAAEILFGDSRAVIKVDCAASSTLMRLPS